MLPILCDCCLHRWSECPSWSHREERERTSPRLVDWLVQSLHLNCPSRHSQHNSPGAHQEYEKLEIIIVFLLSLHLF